jgi:8-oxo-dGTP pyrophosphatase MutT (NUDIX family)
MSDLHWQTLDSDTLLDCRVFTVGRRRRRNHSRSGEFFVLEGNDWCNIIPITANGELVLIEQYRHGTDDVTLEIPGGIVDETDASPLDAARREMLEECGYDSARIEPLGLVHPNPAIQGNRCHSFVAFDASLTAAPRPDDMEEIRTRLVPMSTVPLMLRNGEISHALVVVALLKLFMISPEYSHSGLHGNNFVSQH